MHVEGFGDAKTAVLFIAHGFQILSCRDLLKYKSRNELYLKYEVTIFRYLFIHIFTFLQQLEACKSRKGFLLASDS